MKIGIICALQYEAELLQSKLKNTTKTTVSAMTFTHGTLGNTEVIIAVCGVGKVFAAMCAQTMALTYSPDVIVNSGVAGAISKELDCGDITVATSVVQHDMDTSPLGDPKGLISGINVVNFNCDTNVCQSIEKIAKDRGANVLKGVIATGDKFIASADDKDFIENTFDAIACDMEAGAIAQVCYVNNVPFCIIRAISDSADGKASVDYPAFSRQAAKNAAEILEQYILNVNE